MHSKSVRMAVAALAFMAVLVSACGQGNTPTVEPTQPSVPSEPTGATVEISGFAFDPPMLAVQVGTTVTWANLDSVGHTVTGDSGEWESSRLAQGETFSFVFQQTGTFTYHCTPHPNMTGTIIVTE